MQRVLFWGLGIGGVISLFVVVLLATGPGHHDLLFNADLLLLLVGVVFLHRAMRISNDGSLSYLRALAAGAAVCLIAALCSRFTYYCYLAYVDDSLFGMIADQWRLHFESQGLDAAAIDERLAGMTFSAAKFARGNFLSFLIPGLVLVAIASIFPRRRAKIDRMVTEARPVSGSDGFA